MEQRSRAPWSDDDLCVLSDLIGDGWPRRAVAARLGRSVHAVAAMAAKIGLRIRRATTVAFQVQIDAEVFDDLARLARERYVTPTTLCRLIVELSLKSPIWLTRLFDDVYDDRRGIAATVHDRPSAPLSAAVSVSPPLPRPSGLLMAFAPQLTGTVGSVRVEASLPN
jgi:hypothetical protein